jgi:uncharacterized damage-inducible protein DinB
MSDRRERRLERRLLDHQAAVREFVERARAIDSARWLTPRGDGKWTPAQETKHVILAYESFSRELAGGQPMALRATSFKRRIYRFIGLTQILWRKKIPIAVKAPREARPEWIDATASELLPQLAQRATEFEASFARSWRTDPGKRLTHYLFGTLSLDQAIRLVSVHTRHHAAFLPNPPTLDPKATFQ